MNNLLIKSRLFTVLKIFALPIIVLGWAFSVYFEKDIQSIMAPITPIFDAGTSIIAVLMVIVSVGMIVIFCVAIFLTIRERSNTRADFVINLCKLAALIVLFVASVKNGGEYIIGVWAVYGALKLWDIFKEE